jgi:hypothetical protein
MSQSATLQSTSAQTNIGILNRSNHISSAFGCFQIRSACLECTEGLLVLFCSVFFLRNLTSQDNDLEQSNVHPPPPSLSVMCVNVQISSTQRFLAATRATSELLQWSRSGRRCNVRAASCRTTRCVWPPRFSGWMTSGVRGRGFALCVESSILCAASTYYVLDLDIHNRISHISMYR